MKIRHPLLIKTVAFFGAFLLRTWMGSVRLRHRPLGGDWAPTNPELEGRYIYAFWHEDILVPSHRYGRRDVYVLISEHADGRLIAEMCRHIGIRTVAGSKSRGGAKALRQLQRIGGKAHLVITPDGPRGPRRRVQPGLVYLAAQTGLPIVPSGFGYSCAWRLRSWDHFAVPCPGSAAVLVTGEPIHVPPDVSPRHRDQLEPHRLRVEQAMLHVAAEAERLAKREGW